LSSRNQELDVHERARLDAATVNSIIQVETFANQLAGGQQHP
jgi:hypothetical protein